MRSRNWMAAATLAAVAVLAGGEALAKRPGGGGGPPGDGGGSTPDPAIVYVDAPDLMVMDANGDNASVLVAGAASTWSASIRPHWSPDGEWVVFNSADEKLGGPGIYVASKDGATVKKVAATTQLPFSPNWGPGKDASGNHLIVYSASEPYGESDLFLLRLDAALDPVDTEPALLTDETDDYSDWDPTWAPDGRTIAAFRDLLNAGGGTFSLVLYELDDDLVAGEPIIKITNFGVATGVIGQELDFANGKNVLAMIGRVGSNHDLYTLDLGDDPINGTPGPLVRVTTAPDGDLHPSWSPDDKQLVYYRNAPMNKDKGIEVVAEGGGTSTRLIKGWQSAPDWRP